VLSGEAGCAESLGLIGGVDRPRRGRGVGSGAGGRASGSAEAVVDPGVLAMPPHISWEQAKSFTRAALGDV
jgi:hypothetical protein